MIIRKSELTASKWSGGTTTELFIYPENSNYAARDFDYRISTATVETDRSEFTDLTGYQRILCVLSGELTMQYHTDSEKPDSLELLPLEQVSFPGDLKVVGLGKVTDFNIIYKPEYDASAEIIHYGENDQLELTPKEERYFIWVIEGELLTSYGCCNPNELYIVETNCTTILRATVNSTILLIKLSHDIFRGKA